ncbi:MAG: hypothetical protein QXK76_01345 [Candidatus Woesearchaeota archaeon]
MELKEIIDQKIQEIFSYNNIDYSNKENLFGEISPELISYLLSEGRKLAKNFEKEYGLEELVFQSRVIKKEDDYSIPLYEQTIPLLLQDKNTYSEFNIIMCAFLCAGVDSYIIRKKEYI